MSQITNFAFASAVSIAFLSGCGGGGSSDAAAPVAPAASQGAVPATAGLTSPAVAAFPLQSGYKARIATGSIDDFIVSGSCSGLATLSNSAPFSGVFEGASAQMIATTIRINFNNCSPSTFASTSNGYYDSNYNVLGHSTPGAEYGKFLTVPSPLPVTVKVGDTGVYGIETIYTDGTKSMVLGQRNLSYVIEADNTSTSTAIANLITRDFSTSNQLLFTQQSRYRIASNGQLSAVSIDVQYSGLSSNHFLYTKTISTTPGSSSIGSTSIGSTSIGATSTGATSTGTSSSGSTSTGRCQVPSDIAADGSRCGNRAASVR